MLALNKGFRRLSIAAVATKHTRIDNKTILTSSLNSNELTSLIKPARNVMKEVLDSLRDQDLPFSSIISPIIDGGSNMKMDVKETPTSYVISMDLPGVEKKDIEVAIKDSIMTVSAHRESTKKYEGETFRRVERSAGTSTRTVMLPENVDEDSVEAKLDNGVLHLKIKKIETPELAEPKIVKIT